MIVRIFKEVHMRDLICGICLCPRFGLSRAIARAGENSRARNLNGLGEEHG